MVCVRRPSAGNLFHEEQHHIQLEPSCVARSDRESAEDESWECNILELRGESTSESGSGRSSESSRSDHAPLATALSKREECCACQPGETCLHDGSVPMYLRRAFMYTGYPTAKTHAAALKQTLLSWNNQTLNCWTMIVGAACSWLAFIYSRREFEVLGANTVPLWILLLSAIVQTAVSVCFHSFIGISATVRDFWRTADVSVILIGMGVRSAAMVACATSRMTTSCHLLALLAAFGVVLKTCAFGRRSIKDLQKRTIGQLLAAMSLAYFLPPTFAVVGALGWTSPVGVGALLCAAALHWASFWAGGLAYAEHWPERWLPGKLDYVLNSHQLMHVMASVTHVCEYWLCVEMYRRASGLGDLQASIAV